MALTTNTNKGHKIIHITGTTTTPSSIFTDDKFIDRIVWDGPTTAGHKLSILTGNNKPFYGWTCSVNNSGHDQKLGRFIAGMKIDDLDSGEVYVYYSDA